MDNMTQLKQVKRDLESLSAYTNPNGRTKLQVSFRSKRGLIRLNRLTIEALHQNLRIKSMVLCEFLSKVTAITPSVLTLKRLNDEIVTKIEELELITE